MGDHGKCPQVVGVGRVCGKGTQQVVWGLARIPGCASLHGPRLLGTLQHLQPQPRGLACVYTMLQLGGRKVGWGEAHPVVDASSSWLASVLHGEGELGQAPGLSSLTLSSFKAGICHVR